MVSGHIKLKVIAVDALAYYMDNILLLYRIWRKDYLNTLRNKSDRRKNNSISKGKFHGQVG